MFLEPWFGQLRTTSDKDQAMNTGANDLGYLLSTLNGFQDLAQRGKKPKT